MENTILLDRINFFNSMFEMASKIFETYSNLLRLELNGEKETDKYRSKLGLLKKQVAEEEELYKSANLDTLLVDDLIEHIINVDMGGEYTSDVESIATQNYYDAPVRRVLSMLERFAGLGINLILPDARITYVPVVNESIDEGGEVDIITGKAIADKNSELLFKKRLLINYARLLQDEIDNDTVDFKSFLIGSKYFSSFINPDLELSMLLSGFNGLSTDNSDTLKLVRVEEMDEEERNLVEALYQSYLEDICRDSINELLSIEDDSYEDELTSVNSYIRYLLLRTVFIDMEDEMSVEIYFNLNSFIESPENQDDFINKQKSLDVVLNLFRKLKSDKVKYKK